MLYFLALYTLGNAASLDAEKQRCSANLPSTILRVTGITILHNNYVNKSTVSVWCLVGLLLVTAIYEPLLLLP